MQLEQWGCVLVSETLHETFPFYVKKFFGPGVSNQHRALSTPLQINLIPQKLHVFKYTVYYK